MLRERSGGAETGCLSVFVTRFGSVVDVADRHLTIVECRPPWRADVGSDWTRFPIARLRYVKTTGLWSLYWRDRNLRFHAYDLAAPTASIEELLAELDRDPTAIFWG